MKNIPKELEKAFNADEDFQRQASAYSRKIRTDISWKVVPYSVLLIKTWMTNDMFSRQYTDMSESEKDVIQKTYYHINQILSFFEDPVRWVDKRRERRERMKTRIADLSERRSSEMGGRTW